MPGFRTTLVLEPGARFRIRSMNVDIHPQWPNFAPLVQVLDPCTTPCTVGDARCFEDQVCYRAGPSFCNHCLALGVETCACLAAEGPASEGDLCEFFVSGDLIYSGVCQQGICQ